MMVPGLFERPEVVSAIKKIAVFPGVGGGRTGLGENVFYENKFAVPPLLANDVILVALDGEGKPFERLKRLTSRWNPNDCIRLASRKMLEKAELKPELDEQSAAQEVRDKKLGRATFMAQLSALDEARKAGVLDCEVKITLLNKAKLLKKKEEKK